VPAEVNVRPFHTYGKSLGQMLTFVVEELVDFTVKFNVAELSHPTALVNPVFVCVPAAVNVSPFHTYGKSLGQMLRLVVEELVDFTVKFNVAELSHPTALVNPVFVCVPAEVNVSPFHTYGKSLGQMLTFVVEELVDLIVKFNVAELSHPTALVNPVFVCVPAEVNVSPFHTYGKSLGQILTFVVEELVDFTVKFNVAELSHPTALVNPVFVCVPAAVNVSPFHT